MNSRKYQEISVCTSLLLALCAGIAAYVVTRKFELAALAGQVVFVIGGTVYFASLVVAIHRLHRHSAWYPAAAKSAMLYALLISLPFIATFCAAVLSEHDRYQLLLVTARFVATWAFLLSFLVCTFMSRALIAQTNAG